MVLLSWGEVASVSKVHKASVIFIEVLPGVAKHAYIPTAGRQW
jgi:hypothetical protein